MERAALFKLKGRSVVLHIDEEEGDGLYLEPHRAEIGGCCCRKQEVPLEHIPWDEVLSVRLAPGKSGCLGRRRRKQQQVLLLSVLCRHPTRPWQWSVRQLELRAQQEGVAAHWLQLLQQHVQALPHRPRRLLVFVNPFGGKRQASRIWERVAAPLLQQAGVACDVVQTTHQGHAEQVVRSLSAAQVALLDGLVAVGGDGLFAELLTGVLQHDDLHGALGLRLAHIPAGSTDAVACTLHGTRDALTAALHIIIGDQTALDVGQLVPLPAAGAGAAGQGTCCEQPCGPEQQHPAAGSSQPQQLVRSQPLPVESPARHFVCVASFGFLGDVLAISERLRWLGPARYDIAGALSFLRLRSYEAEVWFKPAGVADPGSLHVPATAQQAVSSPRAGLRHQLPRPAAKASGCSQHMYHQLQENETTVAGFQASSHLDKAAAATAPTQPGGGSGGGCDAAVAAVHVSAGSVTSSSSGGGGGGAANVLHPCHSKCGVCSAAATLRHSSSREHLFAADSRAIRGAATAAAPAPAAAAAAGADDGWVKVRSKFASIMCLVTSCRSDKSRQGLVPGAHLADGALVLVLVRKASRAAFLRFLLQLTTRGVLPETPGVQVEYVTAAQVHPCGRRQTGCWNVDGELLRHGRVAMGVHGGLVDVFARGVEVQPDLALA